MKRTDLERKERELDRKEKRNRQLARQTEPDEEYNPGYFIKQLTALYRHDDEKIYNTQTDEKILELLLLMKESIAEKQWEPVIRKSVKATGITGKEKAIEELQAMMKD